jgi:hypothetical protein
MLLDIRRQFPLAWRMARPYRLPSSEAGQPYFVSWLPGGGTFGEHWTRAQFDAKGVIRSQGTYYNPVTVANYALYHYEQLYRGIECARAPFLAQVDYLLHSQREDGAYPYAFALPRYGVGPGWLSAQAQGEAASALIRAYYVTKDPTYREAAVRAARLLGVDVSAGGVSFIRNGSVFFEELASADPVHILNGHLYAAFALWELTHFKIAPFLSDLHAAAVDTLESWLGKYDAGGWSYYHLAARDGERRYATLFYHQTHVAQLHIYAAMTNRSAFMAASRRWRSAMDDARVRARVWIDGMEWLLKGMLRHARGSPTSPWVAIKQ